MSHSRPADPLILGLGLVAASGCDVGTACAAARSGVIRSRVLENYRIRSAVDGQPEAVIGHPVSLLTHGFEGEARLLRLLVGALEDLMLQTQGMRQIDSAPGFYLSLPDPGRSMSGLVLVCNEAERQIRESACRESERTVVDSALPSRLLNKAKGLAGWPWPSELRFVSTSGHSAGITVLQAAIRELQQGKVRAAVVVGVDSLLDEGTLDWLNNLGRLKCAATPAGLQPGEAGVAVLLTMSNGHGRSTGGPFCLLSAVETAVENRNLLSGDAPMGEGLAVAIDAVCSCSNALPVFAWLVSDHNGEVYRASDWGHALIRLRSRYPAFATPECWFPAMSFGDTGAASALLGVCLAVKAFERHYAPAPGALIVSASDGGGRGAALVQYRSS